MATAWGTSWGVAWGVSWGSDTPPTPTSQPFTGGGFWVNKSKKFRKNLDAEYLADRVALREQLEFATGLKQPAVQDIVSEIREVVSPYIDKTPEGPKLDIAALWNISEDLGYVKNLLAMLDAELEENDEDDVFLLM